MTSGAGPQSIASSYSLCIRSFDRLCELLQKPDCEFSAQISLAALQDELGRFRVWAGNVGAHRNGKISLDYKLREASKVRGKVTEFLQDLDGALREAVSIVSHERKPSDELSWPSDSSTSSEDGSMEEFEEEINPTTELQERFMEITHVITCLYKFSIVIRNPAPHDRLQKCSSIDVSHYEPFDIQHTSHKFPRAEKYLIDRLGKANSKRRQLFKYHEKHHNKLNRYIDLQRNVPVDLKLNQHEGTYDEKAIPGKIGGDQSLQDHRPMKKGPGTVATTVNTQTTVSTYVQGPSDTTEVCSDAGQSQTSYATSANEDTRSKLRVPPPPKPDSTLDGNPFECPYCFSIEVVRSPQAWMKHVFRDLRPYVCTFRDCAKPDRLFDSRHNWYNHEVEVHRREWFCNACHQPSHTKALFENHLRQNHSDLFTETQLPAVVDRCERAIDSEQTCPLCKESYPLHRLQSHLARHMQQLALFTLPKIHEDTSTEEGSLGAQASISDEEKAEESFLESTNLDLTPNSPQKTIDGISDTQGEIPDMKDETWEHLKAIKDPDYGEPRLESGNEPLNEVSASSIEELEGAIKEMGKKLDPEHPDTLTCMAKLAMKYVDQGLLTEAEEIQAQVMATRKIVLGNDHPDTIATMASLVSIYWSQRRWKEVEELGVQVLDTRQRVLGEDHRDTLASMASLVSMYLAQKRWEDAEMVMLFKDNGHFSVNLDTLARMTNLALMHVEPKGLGEGALYEAAHGGHGKVVQLLLENGADVNAQGGYYGNALQAAAAYGGHEEIVQLLRENGADVNAQGGYYGNALQAAAYRGHEKIVQLLENGADVNAQGGYYGNALQAAAYGGHENIVQLLLEKGADVNAQGGEYGNALQAAAYGGHEKIVQLLLENGADVNAQGGYYGNALQAAAYGGHENIVQLLLEKGADVNAQGGKYGNALQVAAYGGHEEFVQLLLEKGADVNAQGGEYGNALQAAAYGGHEEFVQLLLENGADVNAQGGAYGNALQVAAYGGHEEFVQLLLENGADVNAQGGKYGNALQAAAYGGHENIVQLLLEKGADVNAQGGKYGNALQAAAYGGHEKIVQLLLEKGADVNAQEGEYGNALQAAAYGGHEKIVQLLLEKGADVNAQEGEYGNALQAAAYGGHENIVQLLLEKGADVNAQEGEYGNALRAAAYGGHEKIVQLLLEKGADVNAQGEDYGNALLAAAYRGHEKIVQLLLENGADVNAQRGEYGNALQAAAYRGHEKIVQLLLENGADINSVKEIYYYKKAVQLVIENARQA